MTPEEARGRLIALRFEAAEMERRYREETFHRFLCLLAGLAIGFAFAVWWIRPS